MAPARSDSGFAALFKNKPFLALWTGQVLSQVADKVFLVLLIVLLDSYNVPPNWENSAQSMVLIANTLPAILFGSAAGIFVDRFDKKQILAGCNLLRGLLIFVVLVLPKEFSVLLALAFVESLLTQFFAPAEQAAIPLLVPKQGLLSANALFTTTMMGSLIVGFAIGEPLLTFSRSWGEFGQEVLVGGLYVSAALVLYTLPLHRTGADPQLVPAHPWSDFKAGLAYLRKNRLISSAMVQLTLLYSVFAALMVLAPPLVKEIGLERTKFGSLLAASGVGMVFGAGVLGHWGDRFRHKPLPLLGFLVMAICLGVFTFVHDLRVGLGLSVLLGIGASFVGVPMQTLIQQQTPEAMRGKVFGFQNNVVNIALSLPLAIAGPLTDTVGLRAVLVGMSAIVITVGVWAWQNTRRVLQDAL
ncbi:MFS transporter [Leptolyngbya sp. FACHB-36]|uniref:MFS transporter n=1 Tax=Leptolyngbya sp. FACHB-36 TaxID=2692808 RepID=UPI0016807273|nr:MFS transporter [Leptolyngbya sp. FACHB-36]MBD2022743.1 MFS transporter [Leptolyngbya sp. FACHB-36]